MFTFPPPSSPLTHSPTQDTLNSLVVEGHAHEVLGLDAAGGTRGLQGVEPLLHLPPRQLLVHALAEPEAVVPAVYLIATVLAVLR